MSKKSKEMDTLLTAYKEISLLNKINSLLGWDLNVNLPEKGAEERAQQTAYLTKLISDKWLDEEFKDLVEESDESDKSLSEEERAMVRNLKHEGKFYFKVPQKVIVEFSEETSKAFMAWQKAKKEDNFKDFEPHLKKLVKLNQLIADHLGFKENKYDALLDLFEPGLTTKEVAAVFNELQPELTMLLKNIQKSKTYNINPDLIDGTRTYPVDDQRQLSLFVLRRMNYDLDAGRMDVSSHPFTDTLGAFDVRITNRYKSTDFIESIMVAMHEGGHALYEQGIEPEYSVTPLEGGVSLGIHESQSRFWENQIGRSEAFAKFLTPILHAFYPEALSDFGAETFYRAFNQVKPGLVRVEADEVTYNLHIALRFEIEQGLVNDKMNAADLPEIWRAKMEKYLGVVPDTDREGVLQDVHWSHGMMGYFPTYTLGNLYAAQFTDTMEKEFNLNDLIEKGELGTVLSWLRTNIHQYGGLYWPKELVKKVTGKPLNAKYFTDYLRKKYTALYSL